MDDYRDKIDWVLYSLDEFSGNPEKLAPVKDYLLQVLAWDPEVIARQWPQIRKKYINLASTSKMLRKLPEL